MLKTELKQDLQGDCHNHASDQASPSANQYEQDFYAWTQKQAQLLRTGKLDEIDWQFKERKIKPEIKEEHFSYWNNKLIVIKQLLEKLS